MIMSLPIDIFLLIPELEIAQLAVKKFTKKLESG